MVEMYHNVGQAISEGNEIRVVFYDVKGFYLSRKMWHYMHPTMMALTLLLRALPKDGFK